MVFIPIPMKDDDEDDIQNKKELEEEPEAFSIRQSVVSENENMIFKEWHKENHDLDLINKSMDKGDMSYIEWYKEDGQVFKRLWCNFGDGGKAKSLTSIDKN